MGKTITHLKFPGRGQRETPVGDIYTVVELIMLLPGKRAGLACIGYKGLEEDYHVRLSRVS